jgi:hypothetical protein
LDVLQKNLTKNVIIGFVFLKLQTLNETIFWMIKEPWVNKSGPKAKVRRALVDGLSHELQPISGFDYHANQWDMKMKRTPTYFKNKLGCGGWGIPSS